MKKEILNYNNLISAYLSSKQISEDEKFNTLKLIVTTCNNLMSSTKKKFRKIKVKKVGKNKFLKDLLVNVIGFEECGIDFILKIEQNDVIKHVHHALKKLIANDLVDVDNDDNDDEGKNNEKENFFFFWKSNSPFSQWYEHVFIHPSLDEEFNTCEQYMMAGKAALFNDLETRKLIMSEKSPRKQKALGRKVKNFDEEKWKKNRELIIFEGNYAKFISCKELKEHILNTGSDTIVEASPVDKIYGIGLAEDHKDATNRKKWKGMNLLGKCLVNVREKIREEEAKKNN